MLAAAWLVFVGGGLSFVAAFGWILFFRFILGHSPVP
jgi:hypothetical protein